MPLHSTEAFVLRTYPFAEADKIVIFLTRDQGKVRGAAHGARKVKSRFGAAFEPFTEVSLTYFQKEGRDLVSISGCEITRSHFMSATRDVETAGAFSYMAELLSEFLPDNEPNERLYRLVSATLEAIEEGHGLEPLLRYFESWLLRLAGFFPDLARCSSCDEAIGVDESAFLTAEGAPRCQQCSGGLGSQVDARLRAVIRELFRLHPSAFAQVRARAGQIAALGEVNYQMIRHALERDLRSRPMLKQISMA